MFLSSAEHSLLKRKGTFFHIQMRVLSFKDKLFIVLSFLFQLLTDFDHSLLDHLWFQMSRQPFFCFSWVKVPLIHIMRGNTSFHCIFSSIWKGAAPLVFLRHDSLWDGKKKNILCVSTVIKACLTPYCIGEMLWVFARSFLIFEFAVTGFFCSVIQNSHPPGTTACIYSLFPEF